MPAPPFLHMGSRSGTSSSCCDRLSLLEWAFYFLALEGHIMAGGPPYTVDLPPGGYHIFIT